MAARFELHGITFSGPTAEEWAFGSLSGFVLRAEP